MSLKVKGVTYDVGMPVIKGELTRESLPLDIVKREMLIIANELHCTAVRITGQDLGRLKMAANVAAEQGLDVWFSPLLYDANEKETFDQIIKSAMICEEIRKQDNKVVLVIGCEFSIFMTGLIPGDNPLKRLEFLTDPSQWTEEFFTHPSPIERLNKFLTSTVREVRKQFSGPLTYAAGLWEEIDWNIFDFVGIDAYRDASNANNFRELIRGYKVYGKPIFITEFGCCTYKGASDQGSMGWLVIDRKSKPWQLNKPLIRDEEEQAKFIIEMLKLFTDEGVDGVFVFTFVTPSYPSNIVPLYDLDIASYSIVRTWNGNETSQAPLNWEPKESFQVISQYFGRLS
ncbi:hypothetical protein [Bacillus sp. MUM 116]|uniref:glycoside hydrolase family 113 n=1 Tax=Bacillus sp. MUM 116 TaxID=1678002 RepID=UPI0009F1E008|nr:hypothetical protein [Bacillus sp. MUM 116]